jgi:hypothetical protein
LLWGFFYSPSLANRKTTDILSAALRVCDHRESSPEWKIKTSKQRIEQHGEYC